MFDESPRSTEEISPEISQASENGITEIAQAPSAGGEAIGQISAVQGSASITHTDGTKIPAADGAPIYQGDLIETQTDGAVGITFSDESTFSLAGNGSMVIDEMVFDPGSQSGKSTVSIAQGIFTFVSGQIAKTDVDAMIIKTPVAVIGIRGTAGGGEAGPEGTPNTYTMFLDPNTGEVGEMTLRTNGGTTTFNSANQTSVITSSYVPPTIPVILPPAAVAQFYAKAAATGQSSFAAPPPATAAEAAAQQAAGEAFAQAISEGKSPAEAISTASDAGRKSAVEAVLADNPGAFGTEKSADSISKGQKDDILDKVAGRTGDPLDVGTGKGISFGEGLQSQLEDPIDGLTATEDEIKDAVDLAEEVGEDGLEEELFLDFFDDLFFDEGFFEDLFFFDDFFEDIFGDVLFGDGDDDFFEDAILFGFDDPFSFGDDIFFDEAFFFGGEGDEDFVFFEDDEPDFFFDPVVFGDEKFATSGDDILIGGEGNTEFVYAQDEFAFGGNDVITDLGGTRDRITFEALDDVAIKLSNGASDPANFVLIEIDTDISTNVTATELTSGFTVANTITLTRQVEDLQALDSSFLSFDSDGVLLFGALNVTGSQTGYIVAGTSVGETIDLSGFSDSATTIGSIIFGKGGDDTLTGTISEDDILGGAGNDTLDGGGGVNFVEGGSGNDTINVTVASSVNEIDGGTGTDTLNYTPSNVTTYNFGTFGALALSRSGGGADVVFGIEILNAGGGNDTFNFNTISLGFTNINGGGGDDAFIFNTAGAQIAAIIDGGGGTNTITLNAATFLAGSGGVQSISSITGSSGNDTIKFIGGQTGVTVDLNAGSDTVLLADATNTLTISDTETITGGTGNDTITLGAPQSSGTINLGGGTDILNLANGANVLSVSDTEDIQGGTGVDTITLIGSSVQTVTGNAGADILTDSTTGIANTFRYAATNDGAVAGGNSGFDTISGFTTGSDRFGISGSLTSLLDDITVNSSIFFGSTAINLDTTEEGILLTGLADADLVASGFANLLTSLNTALSTASSGADALIVAQGATDTAFYIYQEDGGTVNNVSASELTLLAIVNNEIVVVSDIVVV